ncbi:helix-turn-helix transcriptional regulator [Myroides sp. DF42-4-2]|uniref:helix-turn-helix domain-containing protein n=1 Tax=unclassified Myroides TaxID=2642485 RepID=UPI002576A98C|nr:helix-turn-helix transcriptional regulator [Myroides sp. DF42-4-2]MDM1408580.1 helix-turn-helix transcriptional regulator [Myroides sp. DF42-4-2]
MDTPVNENIERQRFADNLRFLRVKKGVSQQSVSDELKITRARYSKYEEGASEPPFYLLIRISEYFGFGIDVLLVKDVRKMAL